LAVLSLLKGRLVAAGWACRPIPTRDERHVTLITPSRKREGSFKGADQMTIRPLPDFLKKGDKELGFPHPRPEQRLRARMGIPEPERPVPEFVKSSRR
jgi:hypothetical protein